MDAMTIVSGEALAFIILAAGKGTRMRSDMAKVLHCVGGQPMVVRVAEAAMGLHPVACTVVVGHQAEAVREALQDYPLSFALQEEQLGTGHAVACATDHIPPGCSHILVICGDTPLIRKQTLARLYAHHVHTGATLTLLAVQLEDPHGYGRIQRDAAGQIRAIVEEKDANAEEKKIGLVNTGFYCFNREFLEREIKNLRSDNVQKEYYLTDLVAVATAAGDRVECVCVDSPEEVMGVNSPENLEEANRFAGRLTCLQQFP
ncbi:NTP transferase domain-containing protein [Desulfobotulus sp. H1]|uniref:NTP transferase domain-containing protein n=1 Tax=Desulfobotulus pelophilus TaxID=2823377 RepID=A0ABT3ND26_9BACT|nr:sugar phosphate nucleotidyltransferase [Desulfobotulus pelophilus]MCW7755101.1 NTP transferase domain-containing protein [Desulfobotulus pelophilus]